METPSDYDLENWLKDASRQIVCTGCYGSGEDRWNLGRACPVCAGSGRSAAEPHVLRLIAYVYKLRNRLEGRDE